MREGLNNDIFSDKYLSFSFLLFGWAGGPILIVEKKSLQ